MLIIFIDNYTKVCFTKNQTHALVMYTLNSNEEICLPHGTSDCTDILSYKNYLVSYYLFNLDNLVDRIKSFAYIVISVQYHPKAR